MGVCTYMWTIIIPHKVSESHKTWALSSQRNSILDDLSYFNTLSNNWQQNAHIHV